MKMKLDKSPPWKKEELILALDLYFKHTPSGIDDTSPEVIKLSETLRKLDLHENIQNYTSFRSPNAVSLKLQNFRTLDPLFKGKGMPHGGKMDKVVWDEFSLKREYLNESANAIIKKLNKERN